MIATSLLDDDAFRSIVDCTLEVFLGVDLKGRIVSANPAAVNMLALPAAPAILGRAFSDVGLPDALQRMIAQALEELEATGRTERRSLDVEGHSAEGHDYAAAADVFGIEAGSQKVAIAHLHDITRRRRAELKSERLSRILRTMSEGARAIMDAEDETDLYRRMCRVLVEHGEFRMAWVGIAEDDEQQTVRPVAYAGHEAGYLAKAQIVWSDGPKGRGPCGTSIRTGLPQCNSDTAANSIMTPWRDAALECGYLSSLCAPLKDRTRTFGSLTIYASEKGAFGPEETALLVEMTEHIAFGILNLRALKARDEMKNALRHAQKLEAIGRLTGGIAHDFGNVLQIIDSAVFVMRRLPDDAGRRARAIEDIADASRRAASITRQLLAFSRRDALSPQSIELSEMAGKWRDLLESATRERLQIDVSIPPDVWPIWCDRDSLEVALINLAVNARDAMPEGGVLEVIARNAGDRAGEFVEIDVVDAGSGIAEKDLPRVFEPFFTTKPAGEGTGLGLSQVYGFAQQSGGDVQIASASGVGTTVTLRLPRAAATDCGAPVEPPEASEFNLRMLVIGEDAEAADSVRTMAMALGCRVSVADACAEALEQIKTGRFDVLLTDVLTPDGSGVELSKAVREIDDSLRVIMMSGKPQDVGADVSACCVLRKPFPIEDLENALRSGAAGLHS